MTTPKRDEIIEKAVELWRNDRLRSGVPSFDITPEYQELREEGFLIAAQSELMRNPYKQYEIELDEESKDPTSIFDFQFDYELMTRSNLLISGCNHSGKTRLSALICSLLKNLGWQVIVFDNSGVWKEISDLPFCLTITGSDNFRVDKESCIFDISDLTVDGQKFFVDSVLQQVWENRSIYENSWLLIVIEESELYCKNLRGQLSQNIFRIMHSGRNRKVRTLCVTTDLALLDPSFTRLCLQRYHGRLGVEEGSKRKFKSYYGYEWLEETLKLELGQFLYLNDNNLKIVKAPLFTTKTKPRDYLTYLNPPQPKKVSWWQKWWHGKTVGSG